MQLHPSIQHETTRAWQEPSILPKHLIYPLFVTTRKEDKDIQGLEPNKQWGSANDYSTLMSHIKELTELGLKSVMLFGVVAHDDKCPNG